MKTRISLICAALAAAIVFRGAVASAQDSSGGKFIPQTAEGVDDTLGTGWHPTLKGAANFALGHSSNTPGNPDGLSLQFGYLIGATADYMSKQKQHEWTNSLGLELQYSKTPVVDALIKSADKIDFRSAYFFHPAKLPQIGPFVAFRLSAPMLPADAVYAEAQNVVQLEQGEDQLFDDSDVLVDADGNIIDANHESVKQYKSGARIPLTGAFAPLILRESVGIFAVPVNKPTIKFDARLGFGAWETFVRDGFVVDDNADTADILELRRMQDSVQLGPELGVIVNGALKEIFTYRVSALFMQPVYQSTDTELEGIDLMNMEFEAGLGIKLTKYLSIDYSMKAYKQPLIINEWQVQNNLLLSIGFAVPEPPPPPPACPPCPEPECPKETAASSETPAAAPAPAAEAAPATEETDASAAAPTAETAETAPTDESAAANETVPEETAPAAETDAATTAEPAAAAE